MVGRPSQTFATKDVVVTGAGGQVGALLASQAAFRGFEVRAFTHAELDITDENAVRQQVRHGDIVINCAAFTNVDGAESDPQGAYLLNAVGPRHLAQACADVGARLVHLSTDYVFDGKLESGVRRPYEIDDATAPLGTYARSKLEGELAILATTAAATIVRTSLVYTGATGTDFIATMRRCAADSETVDVVSDLTGSITYVRDLVAALLEIAEKDLRAPILHAVNEGAVCRIDLARAIFAEIGADPDRVRPISSEAFSRPAPRPAYSALSMAKSAQAGLTPLRPWRDALVEALMAPLNEGSIA